MTWEIFDFLKMNDVEYKEKASLSAISPIRIGAAALAVVYPDSEKKLLELVRFLESVKIKHKIVGRMSNVLPPDENYNGLVLRTDRMNAYSIESSILTVSCGASMPFMAKILQRAGLSGFEGLSGIPGSIGGAVLGNAGAFGREISDLLIDIEVYDTESGQVLRISKEDCGFSYRHSIFKERNCIILSVRFGLYDSDPDSVLAEMNRCAKARKSTQPTDKLSLGSCFKRPRSDLSAARLIDSCGLKGYSVGGAEISKKHAGFIINNGGATAGDYIALSDYAADCVYQKYGICLEREVEIM